ncbi:retinol dehydrogenase 12-like [Danaus plexippus]|uniref:retinol dehydrogenase 12-like n=1 Tax=Danaus plexippus TaxID=13037 RepID=UPI002AB17566|nr:retinol dehydrogenase 12-like [Danaus plexippus]
MGWFSGRCYSDAKLNGKTIIVTGCNTGIGKVTVEEFYKRGAKVIMACRDVGKAGEAKIDIKETCKNSPNKGELIVEECDLSSFKSIRKFSQKILKSKTEINVLVNNAGVMMAPRGETEDGFETHFGTNHLGHFLLTMLLLPRIIKSTPARIVTVSSKAHSLFNLHLEDLNYTLRPYNSAEAYAQSKIANILFSRELSKKLKSYNIQGINTYSLHPGLIKTDLYRHLNSPIRSLIRTIVVDYIFYPFSKTIEMGAQTTVYCAIDEKCSNETGLYYTDCAVTSPSTHALNDENAKKLWDMSMEMVGLKDFNLFTSVY